MCYDVLLNMQSHNKCCSRFADVIAIDGSSIRKSEDVFFLTTSVKEDYVIEQMLDFCPFCGCDISPEKTHELEGVLDLDINFSIHFVDGVHSYSGCDPIDYSIYHERGGWTCWNDNGGCDIYEKDIIKVFNSDSKELLFERV